MRRLLERKFCIKHESIMPLEIEQLIVFIYLAFDITEIIFKFLAVRSGLDSKNIYVKNLNGMFQK